MYPPFNYKIISLTSFIRRRKGKRKNRKKEKKKDFIKNIKRIRELAR